MALVACKECGAQVFVGADKCPHCGVDKPGVSYEEERLSREKQAADDQLVAEILRLGSQKKDAYLRKDELETQLMARGTLIALLRGIFPSKASKAKRAEQDETVRKIELLRRRMDELRELLPSSRIDEVIHLWDYENTTSLSQIRERRMRDSRKK
jgi:uncharacterized Zn finger protein (UPF0148 family)